MIKWRMGGTCNVQRGEFWILIGNSEGIRPHGPSLRRWYNNTSSKLGLTDGRQCERASQRAEESLLAERLLTSLGEPCFFMNLLFFFIVEFPETRGLTERYVRSFHSLFTIFCRSVCACSNFLDRIPLLAGKLFDILSVHICYRLASLVLSEILAYYVKQDYVKKWRKIETVSVCFWARWHK
jgi:hypothetical protein